MGRQNANSSRCSARLNPNYIFRFVKNLANTKLTYDKNYVLELAGLEYLHHGCKPPIVHRDVKTANILLNEKFQAKLADFGLSRDFPLEGGTHISTSVAGTPGYLDPE